MDLEPIQEALDYIFNDPRLLRQALVHRSYLNEKTKEPDITEHNERLEFLGDAVLELVVTDHLFKEVKQDEGVLTALRAALVNYKTMGQVGTEFNLDQIILLSRGEREELGKARITIVADCVEAIIGAMYLDGGLHIAEKFIRERILILLPEILHSGSYKDYKTLMQEFCQKHTKITPFYKVISSEGKDHAKVFRIGVWVGDEMFGEGEGRSKQEAETEAARNALIILKERYSEKQPTDIKIPSIVDETILPS